jgi:alkylation response protein AidB-like acyl-CoA dehydrogenase
VQLKINEMHMLTEALRSFVLRVAWEHDKKLPDIRPTAGDELLAPTSSRRSPDGNMESTAPPAA